MALFKISKGQRANLPNTYTEGWCYLTTDDGKFYIDTAGTGGSTGARMSLNAHYTDGIRNGVVTGGSVDNYKSVQVSGVDQLFDGLILAIRNNNVVTEYTVYIKINNIVDLGYSSTDTGFRAVNIKYNEPLRDEWEAGQTILVVYDKSQEIWNAIGGISGVDEASTVSILRYSTT